MNDFKWKRHLWFDSWSQLLPNLFRSSDVWFMFLCSGNPNALPLHGIPPHFLHQRRLRPVCLSFSILAGQSQGLEWTAAGELQVLTTLQQEQEPPMTQVWTLLGHLTAGVDVGVKSLPLHCPSTRWTWWHCDWLELLSADPFFLRWYSPNQQAGLKTGAPEDRDEGQGG